MNISENDINIQDITTDKLSVPLCHQGGIFVKNKRSDDNFKSSRALYLYRKFMMGEVVFPVKEAERSGVVKRTVLRDIEGINDFLRSMETNGEHNGKIVFDRTLKGYRLVDGESDLLSCGEMLAVCKILMDCRAFSKDDMSAVINKLLKNCVSARDKKTLNEFISNEFYYYIEPMHKKHFTETLWDIGTAVNENKIMNIDYERPGGIISKIRILPVGIMFFGYYFYLTAFIDKTDKERSPDHNDDISPVIYRIDRIKDHEILNRTFLAPYKDSFEEREFRKRIQFAQDGKQRKIKFLYKGDDIESVLDRLPAAEIQERKANGFVIAAEVFGSGIDMWIKSQGDMIMMM